MCLNDITHGTYLTCGPQADKTHRSRRQRYIPCVCTQKVLQMDWIIDIASRPPDSSIRFPRTTFRSTSSGCGTATW